jgi:hypothetical protein
MYTVPFDKIIDDDFVREGVELKYNSVFADSSKYYKKKQVSAILSSPAGFEGSFSSVAVTSESNLPITSRTSVVSSVSKSTNSKNTVGDLGSIVTSEIPIPLIISGPAPAESFVKTKKLQPVSFKSSSGSVRLPPFGRKSLRSVSVESINSSLTSLSTSLKEKDLENEENNRGEYGRMAFKLLKENKNVVNSQNVVDKQDIENDNLKSKKEKLLQIESPVYSSFTKKPFSTYDMRLQIKDDSFRFGEGYKQFHDESRVIRKREKLYENEKKRELAKNTKNESTINPLNYGSTRSTIKFDYFS